MTAATAPGVDDARLAMEIRLLGLEARITGHRPYSETGVTCDSAGREEITDTPGPSKTALRRVHDIALGIDKAGEGSDSMKRFLTNYESYKPLLIIPGTTQSTSEDVNASADASNSGEPPLSETDLISATVKSTMVLEAARDIQALERDLRRVEGFRDRDVGGAGDLEELVKFRGALQSREARTHARMLEMNVTRREVGQVFKRYNDYNATVTDMFMDIHHRLEALEDQVARAERRKRKDLEGRY